MTDKGDRAFTMYRLGVASTWPESNFKDATLRAILSRLQALDAREKEQQKNVA